VNILFVIWTRTPLSLGSITEMNLWSLDPFRKMFIRQKHHLEAQVAAKKFIGAV